MQEGDVRGHGAVPVGELRVRWLDDEVLIGCVRAAAVPKTEVPRRETQRLARERIARIAAGDPWHDRRCDAELSEHLDLRLDQGCVEGCVRRVVATARLHLDVAEAALREMRLQLRDRAL